MAGLTVLAEGPFHTVQIAWQETAVRPDPLAAARIDQRWAAYLRDAEQENRSLFNGPVTRLVRAESAGEGIVRLLLAPTDYKTFVVTVLRDRPWFEAHAPEAMARALGNSVLLTHKEEALLGLRSMRTSAYGGRAHLIGGVLDRLGTEELPAGTPGVLAHLRKEMAEEAGVEGKEVSPRGPEALGVVQDEFLGQPELIWQWELRVGVGEIARRLDPAEHHGCVIVRKDGIPPETWQRMTPVARATWERWRSHGRSSV